MPKIWQVEICSCRRSHWSALSTIMCSILSCHIFFTLQILWFSTWPWHTEIDSSLSWRLACNKAEARNQTPQEVAWIIRLDWTKTLAKPIRGERTGEGLLHRREAGSYRRKRQNRYWNSGRGLLSAALFSSLIGVVCKLKSWVSTSRLFMLCQQQL